MAWDLTHDGSFTIKSAYDALISPTHHEERKISPETPIHTVRDCKWAKKVWSKLIHQNMQGKIFNSNILEWIEDNLSENVGVNSSMPWSSIFAFSCWMCWKQRNEQVFSNKTMEVDAILGSIFNQVNCFLKVEKINKAVNFSCFHVAESNMRWEAPKKGTFKLNIDG
ncbi:reverse transcriptase [Senna tora]|uniref:Reverse transcriptase n=1 Tax=Senna tora TaxID=362788 RepID=A0A834TP11_9FABA|nr:reverse transcriptase [Senna tora]